ncbi:MAG: hypothetical protein Q9169_005398 [Polycauliona sp. 2 TL-2023]
MASANFDGCDKHDRAMMEVATQTFNYTFMHHVDPNKDPKEWISIRNLVHVKVDYKKVAGLTHLLKSQMQVVSHQSPPGAASAQMASQLEDLITKTKGWESEMRDIADPKHTDSLSTAILLVQFTSLLLASPPQSQKELASKPGIQLLLSSLSTFAMQRSQSTRLSTGAHSSYNENPRIPLSRPKTSVLLPRTTISSYQNLLSVSPSSAHLHSTLSHLPPDLLKKPYRNPLIPSFFYSTPIFRFFLERSRDKLSNAEICELCPLHEKLLEAPLVHLMGLVGYEMYTHLQSLTGMHPATRHSITNDVLQKLHPWRDRRFCEPGTKVVGCLACQLGKLYQDSRAMEALAVVAKSGRRGKAGIVQLVDEGWMGRYGKESWGVNEVRADRRIASAEDADINAEWRGGLSLRGKGQVEWKEKSGFVLSHASSRVDKAPRSKRHAVHANERVQSRRHSVLPHGSAHAGKPAQSQRPSAQIDKPVHPRGQSVQVDKPAYVAPPQRPDRPQGLTLTMYGKQEDRVMRTPDEDARMIKRKPVPVPKEEKKDRERKTLSTASTVVGSPLNRRSTSVRSSSHQPAPQPRRSTSVRESQQPDPHDRRSGSVRHSRQSTPLVAEPSSPPRAAKHEPETHYNRRAAPSEAHVARPPSSIYSRAQGFPSAQPKNFLRSRSTITKPRTAIQSHLQTEGTHRDVNTTQQTRWSQFNRSKIPTSYNPSQPPTNNGHEKTTTHPVSTVRRTKTNRALGRKVAAGEYHWWDTQYSESEDEKVVVPSTSLRDLRNRNNNTKTNHSQVIEDDTSDEEEQDSEKSNYEGDEDEEEIRQRYLDEHDALLRLARGVQADEVVPHTKDYLDTSPEKLVDMTTVQPLKVGERGPGKGFLRPGWGDTTYGGTVETERVRDRSSPWL